MSYTYIFDGEIELESISALITALNDDVKVVYMRSIGGELDFIEVVLTELYRKNCILIGFGHLASAAFTIFYKYEGVKTLLKGTQGMVHLPTFDVSVRSLIKNSKLSIIDNWDAFQHNSYNTLCKDWINELNSIGIKEDDLLKIEQGDTIYYDWDSLHTLNLGQSYIFPENIKEIFK